MSDRLNITIDAGVGGCIGVCDIDSDAKDHPNKMVFNGTLLLVDEPSTRAPNGADGHRILVRKSIAQKNLKSLIGMGVNYQPNKLSAHNPRHKVGVITGAWIDGKKVNVTGYIFAKDFPEAKKELKNNKLGMSMELADVLVKNKSDPIWDLIDFSFTGATCLLKDAAAYAKTSLTASAERVARQIMKGVMMATKSKKEKKALSGSSRSLGNLLTGIQASITSGLKPFGKQLAKMSAKIDDHDKTITQLAQIAAAGQTNSSSAASNSDSVNAAASSDESVQASDELEAGAGESAAPAPEMKAKKNKAESSSRSSSSISAARKKKDDYSSSSSSDSDSESDMDAELEKLSKSMKNTLAAPDSTGEESSDPELGHLNRKAKNKGRKQEVSAGVHKIVQIAANYQKVASKRIDSMKAEHKKFRKEIRAERSKRKELEAELEDMQAQFENFTKNNIHPRALPSSTAMLLAKSGLDPNQMQAEGRVLTVQEVDEMLASTQLNLSPVEKMTAKNHLLEKGLMEKGEMQPAWLRQN
jgi:hypothetical protein